MERITESKEGEMGRRLFRLVQGENKRLSELWRNAKQSGKVESSAGKKRQNQKKKGVLFPFE